MLVLLVGPTASGKQTLADHLSTLGFTRVSVDPVVPHVAQQDISKTVHFASSSSALAFLTSHWECDYVVPDAFALHANDPSFDLEEWLKRPFTLLVAVTAETLIRFTRSGSTNLHEFIQKDDANLHKNPPPHLSSLFKVMHSASLTINNSFHTLQDLHALISSPAVNLTDPNRLRPNWDLYFMKLCDLAARRSNCMKRRVGCVVTKDRRVIATGYNGTPKGLRNCNEGGCARCNLGVAKCGDALETCICLHAEENALLEAGRERISNGGRAILYCNTCPCIQCARKIIQVGISEVVYSLSYGMDNVTLRLFKEAGIVLRQLDPLESCV
ncbi:Deoxycytidine monophosphate (dCMP) deaminase [Podochytrium sp. JEL0797]|nr:Deoxycytidine monophosphate (dCMP) deaminase [Podochytrium sp. JEL0797]